MKFYILTEKKVNGETVRGWLEADTLQKAIDLRDVFLRTGKAFIVTQVDVLEFPLDEVEGIPV